MLSRGFLRLARTALVTALIIGFAAGGHRIAGGVLPHPGIVAALCSLTLLPVMLATRRRLSFTVLTALLGGGQYFLHWAFTALSVSMPQPAQSLAGHAGLGHAGSHDVGPATFAALGTALGVAPPSHGHHQMFAAHALATVATALLLAFGERALWTMAAWLRPLVDLPRPAPLLATPTSVPALIEAAPRRRRVLLSLPAWRGPPDALAAP